MKSNERGIALVSALLSVALLTLIVLEATDAAMLHSHLARNAGDSSAARLLARAAEEGGSAYLGQMLRTREPTTRLSLLPLSLVVLPLGAGDVSIRVEDEEGKLNLNQIADRPHRRALEKLFESLELDVALLDSVAVWVDADAGPGEASLAAGTCALPFPCQPHGGPLRSLEELRLIQGFDEKTIDSLRPFLTAYRRSDGRDGHQGINADTASARVLAAAGCEVDENYPMPLQGFGKDLPLDDLCPAENRKDGIPIKYGQRSEYFRLFATGRVGSTIESLETVARRQGDRLERLYWSERSR
ncbi:MAG: type II secretion system protein GspK [Candidatus Binatia bacterium]|nr:type II secretion system protein GspK [Candidatus Binatia bacterium]MDG2011513.1 type II secretion system protein GspK [Candidatus Binatia bacterium]